MTIVICTDCNGWGRRKIDVGTHNSEYELEDCTTCNGTGRLIQEVSISHEPFNPDPNECYKLY